MYRLEQDTSGKENDVMEIQEPISQAPIDIVLQEGIPIGIDNSKFKAENKQVSQSSINLNCVQSERVSLSIPNK
jgi:hypothetical protein